MRLCTWIATFNSIMLVIIVLIVFAVKSGNKAAKLPDETRGCSRVTPRQVVPTRSRSLDGTGMSARNACSSGITCISPVRRTASFWGSSAIQNLPEGKEWAGFAAHSHNGYLDTALGMGLPGLALLIAAIVVKPLRDFQAADQGGNDGPLAMVFLRIWLFGLYLSSMESFFLDRADPMWVTFLIAMFGLHYLARFRARTT